MGGVAEEAPITAASGPPAPVPGPRQRGWRPLLPLVIVVAAIGAVILLPNLYSDPNGLDPNVLRASGVSLALLVVIGLTPRLAPSRLVVVGIVTITVSWSAFQGTPTLLAHMGVQQTGDQANFYASAAWFLVTGLVLVIVRLAVRRDRPALRLLHFGWVAAGVTVAGVGVFLLITLLIPAPLLGREGLPIAALARDSAWLVPANMLQGLAQELQFRGLLLGSLEQITTPLRANLTQSVVFGLAHLAIVYQGPVAPFVPVTMALGFLLGLATQRTNSLWPAIVVHMVADVAVLVAVLPGLYGF